MELKQTTWQIDKNINLGNLLLIASLFVTGLLGFTQLQQEVAVQTQRTITNELAIQTVKTDVNTTLNDLKYEIRELRTELRNAQKKP